jgi:hypothetical protein
VKHEEPEHTLEFLLAFDGRVHWLDRGHWIKFEIRRIEPTPERPHGLRYSFTLHDPQGKRLVGFDNSHGVSERGSRFTAKPAAMDHWHRTENDRGRPYAFKNADTLLADFFAEVRRVLAEQGLADAVVRVEETKEKK